MENTSIIISLNHKLDEAEEELLAISADFVRIHKAYLVNMEHITDVQEDFILRDGSCVPIRVRGRKEVVDIYNDFFMKTTGEI